MLRAAAFLLVVTGVLAEDAYYGKLLGKLSELHHGVSGTVYAVDARTLHVRDLTYDGEGPDAFFYAGSSKSPSGSGFRIRDEKGTLNVLKKYRKKHVTLTLPEGKTLANIRWFSLWCREFSVNFGDVKIPKGFDFPKPSTLGALSGIHGVSSDPIVVVDAQTLLVPNFSYDGEAPDAKFWVGSGSKPSPQGIRVADENGRFVPLKKYAGQTLVITLPGTLTVHEIGHFGVWCEAFAVDFAHVDVPKALPVPPSLRMLGVSPQSKLNCEVLHDPLAFEVRWAVAGDSLVTQLVAKLDAGDYMAFGVSGELSRTQMIGGDAVVAWVDRETLQGNAHDYYLDSKSQCAGTRGSCPDQRLQDGAESVRLLNAALVNGYSIITYQRPLKARDQFDKTILSNGTRQAVIWAVGPLNSRNEVSYHSTAVARGDTLFDFGRSPEWNCPLPETNNPSMIDEDDEDEIPPVTGVKPFVPVAPATPAPAPTNNAWFIPPIQCHEPEDGVFYAQMGPTGGKRGYPAITGHVGWGISWYINGLLIPEINVVRGKSYTFVVEGGDDPEVPARYHPFYITDDSVGGYEHKTNQERKNVRVFAGVKFDKRGKATPTGTGRLCNWTPDPDYPADESDSFGAYQRSLRLECDPGEPGILRWTPDDNTPDTVYYQCYTHRYLGWKINVVDDCDQSSSESKHIEQNSSGNKHHIEDDEYEPEASIQVDTRVKVPSTHKNPPTEENTAERVSYITSLTSQAAVKVQEDKVIPGESPETELTPPPFTQEILSPFNEGSRRIGGGEENTTDLFESPKNTETFEPMFIPSPIDRNRIAGAEIPARRPILPNKSGHLRRPNFPNRPSVRRPFRPPPNRRYFGEATAANERVDTYYLPPGARPPIRALSHGTVLTYDGKQVEDKTIIKPPPTEKLPAGRAATSNSQSLVSTPQFGPFRGEIPPPIPANIPSNIPQLQAHRRDIDQVATKVKRSADHEPGHHDHDHHDPKAEPEPEPEPTAADHTNSATMTGSSLLVTFIIAAIILIKH